MPPRHAYWTILLGTAPTAFRARYRDELLPTFERLRQKQPDAVLRWFERGRLWNSPEEARGGERRGGDEHRRGPDWRPGGEHRDPRTRFKDDKKKKDRRDPRGTGRSRERERAAGGPHEERRSARPPRHPARDRLREPRDRRGPQKRDERPRRDLRDRPPREAERNRPRDARDTRPQDRRPAWREEKAGREKGNVRGRDTAFPRDRRDRPADVKSDAPPRDDTPREERARKGGTRLVRKVRR